MVLSNPVYLIIAVRTVQFTLVGLAGHVFLGWPLTGWEGVGVWVTGVLCLYCVFCFVGHWSWGLPICTRLSAQFNAVALTFDDGPTETTARILDILRESGAQATFFVLGERAMLRPDLVGRMVAEGHAVGLHGFRHRPYVLLNGDAVRRDVERARAAVPNVRAHWVRPPHGFKTLALPFLLRGMGYGMAAWSVNSRDYQLSTANAIAARVLQQARSGAIVLLHDGIGNGATAEALPLILDGLRARGLRAVALNAPPKVGQTPFSA